MHPSHPLNIHARKIAADNAAAFANREKLKATSNECRKLFIQSIKNRDEEEMRVTHRHAIRASEAYQAAA